MVSKPLGSILKSKGGFIVKIFVSFITVMLFWVGLVSAGHTVKKEEAFIQNYVYVKEIYEVSKNETLDTITDKFIKKNTYGPREHREFRQGIIELNTWLLERELKAKDRLEIRYWRKR